MTPVALRAFTWRSSWTPRVCPPSTPQATCCPPHTCTTCSRGNDSGAAAPQRPCVQPLREQPVLRPASVMIAPAMPRASPPAGAAWRRGGLAASRTRATTTHHPCRARAPPPAPPCRPRRAAHRRISRRVAPRAWVPLCRCTVCPLRPCPARTGPAPSAWHWRCSAGRRLGSWRCAFALSHCARCLQHVP